MKSFTPNLEELPETQKAIWSKLGWNENQRTSAARRNRYNSALMEVQALTP